MYTSSYMNLTYSAQYGQWYQKMSCRVTLGLPGVPHRMSISRGACLGVAARPTACTYICMYACMYACHVYACMCHWKLSLFWKLCICTYVYMYVSTYMYFGEQICGYVCRSIHRRDMRHFYMEMQTTYCRTHPRQSKNAS
jgi:hypothetical protein